MISRVMRYSYFFLIGCITHSFLAWVATLNPVLSSLCSAIYALGVLVWVLALLFNAPLQNLLGVRVEDYTLFIVGAPATFLLGASLTWILG